MIDIGVNFTNKRFDIDRPAVVARAKNAGLEALIITGTNIDESQKALALCREYSGYLYCTAGVHPHDADHVSHDYLEKIYELAQNFEVKAIGECGLDFNRNFSHPIQQQKIFSAQIDLAAQLEMPLFLHQRDAFQPWYQALLPYVDKIPAMVAHCFTGNKTELMACLDAGMYIGITGWVCDERRGQDLRELIKYIPLNRLMIETDAPYLTPRTIKPRPKSSRNEPCYLPYIIQTLSEVTGHDPIDIIHQTQINTKQVFNLAMFDE